MFSLLLKGLISWLVNTVSVDGMCTAIDIHYTQHVQLYTFDLYVYIYIVKNVRFEFATTDF